MRNQKAAVLALSLVLLFPNPPFADEAAKNQSDAGCGKLPWSVARERAWFSDAQLVRRASGSRMRKIDRAVELDLQPTSKVKFFLPPVRKPKSDSFSGEVTFFGVPKPGVYQVTLSDDASVDVFENGVRLKEMDSMSGKDCPGIGRSVRFELAPGDLVLVEVSGAPGKSIKAAFAEATQP